jgi:hypothetical protein
MDDADHLPLQPAAPAADPEQVATLAGALLDPALEPIVELVLHVDRTTDTPQYVAATTDGSVRFTRSVDGPAWRYDVVATEGRNPLADQALDRFSPASDERANRWPDRTQVSYPFGYEMTSQVFDAPWAPDLICEHTSAHNWEDQGGHRGEHGSPTVVQARAPFILSGAGVRQLGVVPRAAKLVDVAPTVLTLMGGAPVDGVGQHGLPRPDALLRWQDGDVIDGVIESPRVAPEHVIGFLFDGCNPNVLHELAAAGEIPNVARLIDQGVSFAHGAMASLPTLTLANHTGILTGAHPGHHRIINNAWFDKATGEQVITNSPATWAWSMANLNPAVETLHQAVKRTWPDALTVSCNEMCDGGADVSIFATMRTGGAIDRPPNAEDLPFATERFVRPVKDYQVASRVDHLSMTQAVDAFTGAHGPLPRFMWVNFSLTDAAFHAGGPHSEIAAASLRDTDARLGQVLGAVERAGVWDAAAFFIVADHGMEENDPSVTGDWGPALAATGVAHRDEAYGFIYAGVEGGRSS